MKKIRVLIVDDSAIVREILSKKLSENPHIEIVATAPDPYIARNKLESLEIDVVTLDIEMPRMDGLTFLKYLMKYKPIPVIIVSSLADGQNQAALEALSFGAVDIVSKTGGPYSVEEVCEELQEKIINAASVPPTRLLAISEKLQKIYGKRKEDVAVEALKSTRVLTRIDTTHKLLVVGASTGGTIALEYLFTHFTTDFPPTLAVIHMPEHFTKSFADRLNGLSAVHIKEACDGEVIMPGTIYIAPGNYHMLVETSGINRKIRIKSGPKIFSQRPAVDPLFFSAAKNVGRNCIGVLLTGMGKDGAAGLKALRDSGAYTIAQDEASCIVFGMPKEAIALGGACEVTPLDSIAESIQKHQ